MNEKDYEWLKANYKLLGNVRMTNEQARMLFDIYNRITNENKPLTSCGRCVHSVKQRLRVEYEIIQNLRNQDR
jgi:hypothetical protein